MRYLTLGQTGLSVSAVTLGFNHVVSSGGLATLESITNTPYEELRMTVVSALEAGINWIDASRGSVAFEKNLGQVLSEFPRGDFILSTSVDSQHCNRAESNASSQEPLRALEETLERLQMAYVDIVYLHGPSIDDLRRREVVQAVQDLKKAGKVRFIGIWAEPNVAVHALVNCHLDVFCTTYDAGNTSANALLLPLASYLKVGVVARVASPASARVNHVESTLAWALANEHVQTVVLDANNAEHIHSQLDFSCLPGGIEREGVANADGVNDRTSCSWVDNPLLQYYHDFEWGVPPDTDERWFEFIVLETFQAGLSWKTILNKRLAFRTAFDGFDVHKVSLYGSDDVARLLQNAGIVRNRKKIEAAIENAKIALQLAERHGSLGAYMSALQKEDDVLLCLQKTFRFVGRTTAESIAFATGLVRPPHSIDCWKNAR